MKEYCIAPPPSDVSASLMRRLSLVLGNFPPYLSQYRRHFVKRFFNERMLFSAESIKAGLIRC